MPAAPLSIGVVTATTNREKSRDCRESWGDVPVFVVAGRDGSGAYTGVVPAFRRGVDQALADARGFDLVACFHDDLEITDPHWAETVCGYFAQNPAMGLAGFGGAIGLGADGLYEQEYRPELLARIGFRSNLVGAEAHGRRSLVPERVACLDGFSLILRREFAEGRIGPHGEPRPATIYDERTTQALRPWTVLEDLGMVHHFYDGALGCLAARYGWETWYLPIACRHYGGRTAVGDPGYQQWALQQADGGDHGFWRAAHRIGYDAFRDVLPLRV